MAHGDPAFSSQPQMELLMGSLLCKQTPGQDRKKVVCMLEGTCAASQGIGIWRAVFPAA